MILRSLVFCFATTVSAHAFGEKVELSCQIDRDAKTQPSSDPVKNLRYRIAGMPVTSVIETDSWTEIEGPTLLPVIGKPTIEARAKQITIMWPVINSAAPHITVEFIIDRFSGRTTVGILTHSDVYPSPWVVNDALGAKCDFIKQKI